MSAVGQIKFLASVRNVEEALTACAGGADIIDCKEPATGALGALEHATVTAIRRAVSTATPVSATVGDLPSEPRILCAAAKAMAATGVDLVKVGIFPGRSAASALAALGQADVGGARLVAVLFADLQPDFQLIDAAAKAGFAGVMLDTADKSAGRLTTHASVHDLTTFVKRARSLGMFAGLAGSLRRADIATLAATDPDVMGFRGALCAAGQRRDSLDGAAVRAIARALAATRSTSPRVETEVVA